MAIDPADERILRAKYLDWCSARVADRFLELTPDQIYELAHRPIEGGGGSGSSTGSAALRMDAARPRSVSGSGGVPPAAEVGGRGPEGVGTVRDSARPLDYASLVARATEALAATLGLPTFEAWRAAYEKAPEQFDAELLGFWKRKV